MARVARAEEMPALGELMPRLHSYVCWDGGHLEPFSKRLRALLPARTLSTPFDVFDVDRDGGDGRCFVRRRENKMLPLAPGVLYEFVDDEETLREASELQVGQVYRLVVSDAAGLRRYDTGDCFRCVGFHWGLPDLRFVGRHGLSYSFTGEKLTASQCESALKEACHHFDWLDREGVSLCCVPEDHPERGPGYRVMVVSESDVFAESEANELEALAEWVESRLCVMNTELAEKLSSGRLATFRAEHCSFRTLVRELGYAESSAEQQFKFLPLYRRLWGGSPRDGERRVVDGGRRDG